MIEIGSAGRSGIVDSVTTPEGVIRPMRPVSSVNQRFPSGPVAMSRAKLPGTAIGNSVRAPVGESRPMRSPRSSTNQTFPSGPAVIPAGELPAASGISVIV